MNGIKKPNEAKIININIKEWYTFGIERSGIIEEGDQGQRGGIWNVWNVIVYILWNLGEALNCI